MSDFNEEKTFRQYLDFKFETISKQIDSLSNSFENEKKILHRRIEENRKSIIEIDKKTIVLGIVVAIIYNGIIGLSSDFFKRFFQW